MESIRNYVDGRLIEADRRYQQLYDLSQKAVDKAAENTDTRLASMNEFRGTLTDQAARMPTRQEVTTMYEAMQLRHTTEIASIRDQLEVEARTNWPFLIGISALAFTLVSGLWVVIGLKIDATDLPVQAAVATSKASVESIDSRLRMVETSAVASGRADEQSRTNRSEIEIRLARAEALVDRGAVARQEAVSSLTSNIVELQSELRGTQTAFNLNIDYSQQMMAVLYAKAFPGSLLPSTNYRLPIGK